MKFFARFPYIVAAFAAVLSSMAVSGNGYAQGPAANSSAGPKFVPGEVLIQFHTGATEPEQQNARNRVRAVLVERVRPASYDLNGNSQFNRKGQMERAVVPSGQSVIATVRALQADPSVAYAEPNWIYTHQATSNDSYYTGGSLWGTYGDTTRPANQYGSQAAKVWANNTVGTKNVYVGIIDEGIQVDHPDLRDNKWVNPFDPADGRDNDGNGYIDDLNGWDFYNGDNTVYDGGTTGSQDTHGTHVAGTIGAKGGNGSGVAGMNWNVTMISAKFLGPDGGTTVDAIKAVNYFTDLKTRHGLNIVAINASWGGSGYSQGLFDAITRAAKANILLVAAAGNEGYDNDVTASYPANYNTTSGAGYDSVISVAAIDKYGAIPSWSEYGRNTVDLGAPGVGITSTLPSNAYGSYSGTSMAAPHVTGAVALYASQYTNAVTAPTAAQIRQAILSTTIPTSSLTGKTVTGGRLNVGSWLIAPIPTTGSLTGKVTNSVTGAVISGATVTMGALSTTTNSTGAYIFNNVTSGEYMVTAGKTGYAGQTQSASVISGATTTVGDFALVRETGSINGTVTQSGTTTVVSGATVSVSTEGMTFTATTGDDGTYTLSNVPTGAQSVTASAASHTTQTKSINVNNGAAIPLSFALVREAGTLTGKLTKAGTTTVINGATVTAGTRSATTNSSGVYTFSGMPTGSYTVTAGKTGYITQTQTVTVNKGTTTSQNFALVWELGTLTGKVTKAGTTTVISGATVTMGTLSATTNSSGVYTLNNVPPGVQSVTVSKAGYAAQTQSATVSSGVTTSLNFALESGKLTGKVTRAGTTTTISGATVTVGGLSTTTNSYGNYTFSNMPTGTYDITVSKAGYTSRTQSVTINNGVTAIVNLTLESGKLTGKVTRAGTTAALSGVTVKIGNLSATTNSYGDYIFNNVPAGTYAVTASKTGYASQAQNAAINSGATTTLNFSL